MCNNRLNQEKDSGFSTSVGIHTLGRMECFADYRYQEKSGNILAFPCDDMERKENNKMGVIIMAANSNGIAASSDSRSTLVDNQNNPYAEPQRTPQKLFKTKYCIFAVCGINMVVVNGAAVPIESVFPSLIEKVKSREEFVQMLTYQFNEIAVAAQGSYQFLIGERVDGMYRISFVDFIKDKGYRMEYDNPATNHSIRMAGNLDFAPRTVNSRADWTLEQMKEVTSKTVESVIHLGEIFTQNGYYSVAEPVQTETFV